MVIELLKYMLIRSNIAELVTNNIICKHLEKGNFQGHYLIFGHGVEWNQNFEARLPDWGEIFCLIHSLLNQTKSI